MKKFLGVLVMLMMISSSCLAMTFSQPVKVGRIIYLPQGDMCIENATYTSTPSTGKF